MFMIESSPSFTWLRQMLRKYSETIFNIKLISSGIDIPIIKIRFPWNCLNDGNIHSGKITSLYWNGFQEVDLRMFLTFWFITYSCWIVLKKTCPFQSRMNIWLMVQSTPVISRQLGAKIHERELSGSPKLATSRIRVPHCDVCTS